MEMMRRCVNGAGFAVFLFVCFGAYGQSSPGPTEAQQVEQIEALRGYCTTAEHTRETRHVSAGAEPSAKEDQLGFTWSADMCNTS